MYSTKNASQQIWLAWQFSYRSTHVQRISYRKRNLEEVNEAAHEHASTLTVRATDLSSTPIEPPF